MMLHLWRCRRAGFTLIEVMIVIAIIAILAGIALPNIREARAEAKYQACMSNCVAIGEAIAAALVRYSDLQLMKLGGYGSDSLPSGHTMFTSYNGEFIENVLIPLGYMQTCPRCPASNGSYAVGFNLDVHFSDEDYFQSWHDWCDSHKSVHGQVLPGYVLGVGAVEYYD